MKASNDRCGLLLRPERHDRFALVVDPIGELLRPSLGVLEDLDEGLDHMTEGIDVVVPNDDRPQVLFVDELFDVLLCDDHRIERLGHGEMTIESSVWVMESSAR